MRAVILGASGQLGRALAPRVPGQVFCLTHAQADLGRPAELRETLLALKPDILFNCAAYNLVDAAEANPRPAFDTNAFGVRDLALVCRDLNCTLVHFSTDYVFGQDETLRSPLTESDAAGPVNAYGVSKLAGESFARHLCPRHFIIRTCGLYGALGKGGKGGNFVETMLRLAAQGKPLRVVADQVCTPSYTGDVAQAAVALSSTSAYGLYHLTNGGCCSWYDLATHILEALASPRR